MAEEEKLGRAEAPTFAGSSRDRRRLRRLWEKTIGPTERRPKQTRPAGRIEPERGGKDKLSLRVYTRSIGLAALVIGMGIGLMQIFFWSAIAFVYLGLIVLFTDVLLEKLNRTPKLAICFCIVAGIWAFTTYIVLSKDPIGIFYEWHPDTQTIRMIVDNRNPDDLHDLDLHFSLRGQGQDVFVLKTVQKSQLSECSLFLAPSADGNVGDRVWRLPTEVLGDFQRTRCEVLPNYSVLIVELLITNGPHPGYVQAPTIKTIGSYRGKFRIFSAPEYVLPMDRYDSGWKFPPPPE